VGAYDVHMPRLDGIQATRRPVSEAGAGAWNIDPGYPDGLYLGVRYRSARGKDWNLDIWFVTSQNGSPTSPT
jgi:hypothetical protein